MNWIKNLFYVPPPPLPTAKQRFAAVIIASCLSAIRFWLTGHLWHLIFITSLWMLLFFTPLALSQLFRILVWLVSFLFTIVSIPVLTFSYITVFTLIGWLKKRQGWDPLRKKRHQQDSYREPPDHWPDHHFKTMY